MHTFRLTQSETFVPALWEHLTDLIGGNRSGAAQPQHVTLECKADYVLLRTQGNCLIYGVLAGVDKASSGRLLTMIARTIVDDAIETAGIDDPAGILRYTDCDLRELLSASTCRSLAEGQLAAAFLFVDHDRKIMRFAGAAMSLHADVGPNWHRIDGKEQALNSEARVVYTNTELPLRDGLRYSFTGVGGTANILYHTIL